MSSTLTKKLAQVKPGTILVGVDMALDRNVAQAIGEHAQRLARFGFPNDRDGYNFFHRRLMQLQDQHQLPAVLVGMEPTNYFWKLLASDLEQRQISYRLVNSYTVKKHREGNQLDSSKDDNRDAFTIAELLRTGKFTATQLLHGGYAELRQHVVLQCRLRKDLRRQKTLIRNLAGQLFPEVTRVFKDLTGETALALLHHQAAAAAIQSQTPDEFIRQVRADFGGRRLMVSKLCQAHLLSSSSIGLTEGTQGLQLALCCHIETWRTLQSQLETVEEALIDIFLTLPEAPYMLSIHALGMITAATILAEIGNPNNYSNSRQLIKLAGIQPVPNVSGRRSRSRTPMSHKGRPRLRTTLFFAVLRLIQRDATFTREYQRYQQREQHPLAKMEALGALMNKLLRVLWSLMRYQRFYDPDHLSPTGN